MQELNARSFLGAAAELRRLRTILDSIPSEEEANFVIDEDRQRLSDANVAMMDAIASIGARAASVSSQRLQEVIDDQSHSLTVGQVRSALLDIEQRFADELGFIRLFVIDTNRSRYLSGAVQLLGNQTANAFQSVWFDCEEAAGCLCLGRPTASVFHSMRMLEIAIRALSKRLEIRDPVKPAERNWGVMLREIKTALEQKYPSRARAAGSEGALLEKIFATLDAVKNPWRNETMHVEGVYTEAEAEHILQCTAVLLQTMAQVFDEDGNDVAGPTLDIHADSEG